MTATTGGSGGASSGAGQSTVATTVQTGATTTNAATTNAATTNAATTNAATNSVAISTSATGGCVGSLTVTIDNGAPTNWGASCAGTYGASYSATAAGWIFAGGPPPGFEALDIAGCASSVAGSTGLTLSITNAMGPGNYMMGTAQYTDPMGGVWSQPGGPFNVTVTAFNPVGGSIDGKFSVGLSKGGNAAHLLDGTFHACHVVDELTP